MHKYRIVTGKGEKIYHELELCNSEELDVSIVIPTYNEEGNIGRLIEEIAKNLKKFSFEIIVVDDASKDKTGELMDSYAKKYPVVAVHREGIRGVFSAQMDGTKIARGKFLGFMDADLSHPPAMLALMLKYPDYDIVNASRYVKGGGEKAPFQRKFGSHMLNILCRILGGIKTKDITGVYHIINKKKFREITFKYPSLWGDFDIELFYRAEKQGFRIKEVPFMYVYRQEGMSKSFNLFRIAYVYSMKALKLRMKH
jgi:dolichol-phosphate mannosyltransferase